MNDKVKQEFERAWAKSAQFADFTTQRTGIYFLATEQAAWEGFQLGRASLAREVPVEAVRKASDACDAMGYFETAERVESFLSTIKELTKP